MTVDSVNNLFNLGRGVSIETSGNGRSADGVEGVAAYLENRSSEFKG